MSIAGNYTPEIWSNGSTLLNSITMTKITDAIKALDEISSRSLDVNFFDDRDYFYLRNIKFVDDFYDSSVWSVSGATMAYDTTNYLLEDRSIKVSETDNTGSTLAFTRTMSNWNFDTFQDSSVSSSNDFIVIVCYISDKTKIDYISFRIGTNTTDFYYCVYDINGNSDISNGWNTIQIKKSDFTLSGSMPNGWADIDHARFDIRTTDNASGAYVSFQWFSVVRIDPVYADYSNPFQKYNGSGWENIFQYYNDYHLLHIDNSGLGFLSPGIFKGNFNSSDITQLLLKTNVKNFFGKFYFGAKKANYCPIITLYADDDNYIICYVTAGVARIGYKLNGAAIVTTIAPNTLSFAINDKVYYHIEKTNNTLRFRVKGGGQSFVEIDVSEFDSLFNIFIGGSQSTPSVNYGCLYDFIISNTNANNFGQAGSIL